MANQERAIDSAKRLAGWEQCKKEWPRWGAENVCVGCMRCTAPGDHRSVGRASKDALRPWNCLSVF